MGADLSVYFVAGVALAMLVLIMRWVFGTSRPHTGRPEHGPNADLGMLRPVLASASRHAAVEAKAMLSQQGIRCSLSRIDTDHYDLLVFSQDLLQAQTALGLAG